MVRQWFRICTTIFAKQRASHGVSTQAQQNGISPKNYYKKHHLLDIAKLS